MAKQHRFDWTAGAFLVVGFLLLPWSALAAGTWIAGVTVGYVVGATARAESHG